MADYPTSPPDFNSVVPPTLNYTRKQPNGLYLTRILEPYIVKTTSIPSTHTNNLNVDSYQEGSNSTKLNTRTFGNSIGNTSNNNMNLNFKSNSQHRITSNIHRNDLQLSFHPLHFPGYPSQPLDYDLAHQASSNIHTKLNGVMPLTPDDQVLHTPLQPPEIKRPEKTSAHTDYRGFNKGWYRPLLGSPTDTIQSPLHTYSDFLSSRDLLSNSSPTSNHLTTLKEAEHIPTRNSQIQNTIVQLPRRLSYSQLHAPTSSPSACTNATVLLPRSTAIEGPQIFCEDHLASPLEINRLSPSTRRHN